MQKILPAVLIFSILFLAAPSFAGMQTYAQSPANTPAATQVPSAAPSVTPAATPAATTAPVNTAAPAATAAPSTAATCTSPYTVQAGDTLTSIAQKCGVDYNALLGANPSFTTPDQIFPGQTVAIPPGSAGVPVTGSGGQTYTVVSGDWLSTIAQRFNTTVQSIVNVNPWISNPNLIFPGWVITLPSGSSSSSSSGIPATGGTSGQTYTVVSGDTLSSIAQHFNTTPAALMSANTWINNPNLIVPGWVITIP